MDNSHTDAYSGNLNKFSKDSNYASYIYQSMKHNRGLYVIAYIKFFVMNFLLGYVMYSILSKVHYDTRHLSLAFEFFITSFTSLVFLSDFRQIHQKASVSIKQIFTHMPVCLFKPSIVISVCMIALYFVGFINWIFPVVIIATVCLILPYCILLLFYSIDENKSYTFRNEEFQQKLHNQNGFVFKTLLWIIFQKKWQLIQLVLLSGLYYFLFAFVDHPQHFTKILPIINGIIFVYTFILCCHIYVFATLTLNDMYNAIFHTDNLICHEDKEQ